MCFDDFDIVVVYCVIFEWCDMCYFMLVFVDLVVFVCLLCVVYYVLSVGFMQLWCFICIIDFVLCIVIYVLVEVECCVMVDVFGECQDEFM